MSAIHGWAAAQAGKALERRTFDMGALGAEEVEVAVDYCGICHSDPSMINNQGACPAARSLPATKSSTGSPRQTPRPMG